MKIKPVGNRLIVRAILPKEKTSGGIYIPDQAKETAQTGIVESVSVDCDLDIDKGGVVVFSKFSGSEITTSDNETLLILLGSDILAVEVK